MRARRTLALVALCASAGCPAPKPPPPPPTAPVASTVAPPPPAPVPTGPLWRPIEGPPLRDAAVYALPVEGGMLLSDGGGARWVVPADGAAPKRATALEKRRVRQVFRDGGSLWGIAADGTVLHAATPLAPWTPVGQEPDGATITSRFGGGWVARSGQKLLRSTDLRSWTAVARLDQRRLLDAHIDAQGRGIALFTPQAIGFTADGGKHWQAERDPALHVTELRPLPGQVLARPGGLTDGILRGYRPGDTKLSRVLLADRTSSTQRARRARNLSIPNLDDRPALAEAGTRVRFDRVDTLFEGSATLEGDTLVSAHWGGVTYRRKLGSIGAFSKTLLGGRAAKCQRSVELASCGKRVIASCRGPLLESIDGGEANELVEDAWAWAVGFITEKKLLFNARGGLYVLSDGGIRELPIELPKGSWAQRMATSCDGRAWLLGRFRNPHVVRVENGVAKTIEVPKHVDPGSDYIGLDAARRPVFLVDGKGDDKGRHFLGRIDERTRWRQSPLPFEPASFEVHLGSLAEDRGMLVGKDGRAHVTFDGGATWRAIPLPTFHGERPRRLVCGTSGCELEGVAMSAGWEVLEAYAALGEEVPASKKKTKPKKAANGEPTLVCKLVPGANDLAVAEMHHVHPGMGTALASAFEWKYGPNGEPARVNELGVAADGSVTRKPWRMRQAQRDNIDEAFSRVALRALYGRWSIQPVTWEWRGATTGRTSTTRFSTNNTAPGINVEMRLQTPRGVALVDATTRRILHVRDDGRSETRSWSPPLTGLFEESPGTLVESKGGDWFVVASWNDMQGSPPGLGLMRLEKSGVGHHRKLVHDGGFASLATDGKQVWLVSEETLDDGSKELRWRLLRADLSLGSVAASQPIRDASGALRMPPPCKGPAPGSLVDYKLRRGHLKAARIAPRGVNWDRRYVQLRVGTKSVCARRTVIGPMVAQGDGNGPGVGVDVIHGRGVPSRDVIVRFTCKRP